MCILKRVEERINTDRISISISMLRKSDFVRTCIEFVLDVVQNSKTDDQIFRIRKVQTGSCKRTVLCEQSSIQNSERANRFV